MGGHPFPKMSCKICSRPVDLCVDLCADENGRVVHEDCYVAQYTRSQTRALRMQCSNPSLALRV
jgi:hypothetical protein